jgi:outer membrane protein assembly factor BamB
MIWKYALPAKPGNFVLEDVEGDPRPEVLFYVKNSIMALSLEGNKLWTVEITEDDSGGRIIPILSDFNGDGSKDVIAFTTYNGWFYCLDAETGKDRN